MAYSCGNLGPNHMSAAKTQFRGLFDFLQRSAVEQTPTPVTREIAGTARKPNARPFGKPTPAATKALPMVDVPPVVLTRLFVTLKSARLNHSTQT